MIKLCSVRIFPLILFALGLAMVGAQSPTLSLNLGPYGYNCGRVSNPTYCMGIPVAASDDDGVNTGSIWLDKGSMYPGFVLFQNNFEGLGQATITSAYQPLSTAGGTVAYTFAGNDSETGKAYTGMLTLTYTAYYSAGGGGRGGAGSGWRWVVMGGSISVSE